MLKTSSKYALFCGHLLACAALGTAAAQERSGELIFKQECAQCHGPAGQGTKDAPRPLVGEKSPAQLANVIGKTMPDDDPGSLPAVENKKVAAYVHDAFYSPDARARVNPPRVELSRLTVRQYKNSVADLTASFGTSAKSDERHGLHGEYVDGRGAFSFEGGRGQKKPLIDRIDAEVRFDWGTSAPDGTPAPPPPPPEPKKTDADKSKKDAPKVADDKKAAENKTSPPPAADSKKTDNSSADDKNKKPADEKKQADTKSTPPTPSANSAPPAVDSKKADEKKPADNKSPAAADSKPAEPRKFNPKQFSISWDGSVFAPETGNYEFIVKSEHAILLWVNDLNNKRPLIDAAVRSLDSQPLRASMLLLGGRSYSIRLEFSKGKELDKKGLDDPKKESKRASIELLWKTPNGNEEVIPARYLSPVRAPESLVINTPFPPDDRSYGWERGTSVSKEWNSATTDAALEAAAYVATRLQALAGVAVDAPDAKTKLRAFALSFAERAFRRPLSDDEKKQFIERQFEASAGGPPAPQIAGKMPAPQQPDLELAIKRVVLLVLKSPRFLYPGVMNDDAYAAASRLSFALWDSPPDQPLLDAAAAKKLSTREEIAAQAERMLASPRAHAKVREFLLTWLRTDRFPELSKDAKRFPGFDAALAADLRTSLSLFLDDVVWSDTSDFRQLLLSDEMYLNGRLSKFYGAELSADAPFIKVKWQPEKRAGVLTHPYMLSGLAYPAESSPIHRGVFVVRGLLGLTLQPPPDAVVPLAPDLHPNLTTRERVMLQTKPQACVQCHALINPLGFALENFDATGRFREEEKGKPIDVSGQFETQAGEMAAFNGAKQLAALLARDEQVQGAFTQQLFQHMLKQPVRAYGLTMPKELQQSFVKSGYNVRKLIVEIATIATQGAKNSKE
ncbi:MAG TPA: DUF1592 domain-containing protein [Planctomycetota bacterium]|nr:DUF1592 domain-containing protein [Planctomycetota bacterium]